MNLSRRKKIIQIETLIILLMGGFLLSANSQASVRKEFNYQGKLTNASGVAVPDGAYDVVFNLYTVAGGGSPVWTESWTASALFTEATTTMTNDGCAAGVDRVAYTTGTNEGSLAAGQTLWNTTLKESAVIQSVVPASNYLCIYAPASTWANGNTVTNRLFVKNGLFSVMVGSITAQTTQFTGADYYLGVTVGSDTEMIPRKKLGAVPQAWNANALVGDGQIDLDRTSPSQDAANINFNPASGSYNALSLIYGAGGGTGSALSILQSGTGSILDAQNGAGSAFLVSASGRVGIGVSSPTALLHLKAGTAAAGSAPLKFTAGANLTTPEAGAMEYDGTQLYFSPNARNIVAQVSGATALTAGSIPFATTSGYLTGDSTNFFWDDANNRLGIGTNTPGEALEVNGKVVVGNNTVSGENVTFDSSTAPGLRLANANGYISLTPLNTGWAHIYTDRSKFIFNAPVYSSLNAFSSYDNNLLLQRNGTTKITVGTSVVTLADALQVSGTGDSYFNGQLGLGTSSPTALLHLKAGTATANTAPLKFTSGTNLTTPEAGVMEYDGTNLYFTPGASRKTIAFTDSNITGTANYANYIWSRDTRAVNDEPDDFNAVIKYDFKNNATNGLSDGGTYNSVMTWRGYGSAADMSGGPVLQMAYSSNKNLWTRFSTSATAWGDWSMLLDSDTGVELQSATPGSAQTGNLNITGTGIFGTGLGLGVSAPTAVLHLKAGTAAAGSAPLKFTSGTNLTTPEAGAMEYDGTQLYFSPNTTRNIVAQISGSTALTAGSIPFATTNGYLAEDNANFFWDSANKRLGLGTNTPSAVLDLTSTGSQLLKATRTGVFDFVQYQRAGGTWTNITAEAGTSLGTVSGDVLDALNDALYIGKADKFSSAYIDVGTATSAGGTFAWEYWNGSAWATLAATDGTSTANGALAQDGVVSFTPPLDWATTTQNSSAQLYFIRLRVTGGSFGTEPTVYLVVPNNDGSPAMEVYANGGDTTPTLSVTRNGGVFMGVAPSSNSTYRLYVSGAGYVSSLALGGALSGVTTLAASGAITDTIGTTGYTHVGGLILNGPAATATIPNQNSPVVRFSSQAWNGSATRINAMDIYVNPDAEYVTNARMAFKATTLDGIADASELMNLDSNGKLSVLGRAQSTDDMFDRVFSYVASAYTDQTLAVSSFGTTTGDVLDVVGNYVYVGKENKFGEMYFDFGTIMSAGTNRTWEYWNGSAWTTLTVTDGTNNWQNDGSVTFAAPGDWSLGTVNNVQGLYWVRVGTASGTFSTEPTLRILLPNTTAITKEVLSNNEFDDASKWTTTGDWAYTTSDYTFTYASGTGTLRQAATDFNSPLEPNTWYRFRYVVGAAAPATTVAWIGDEVATGKTYFSGSTTEVDAFFKTNSNPGDFVLYTTATATSGFRLDSVYLKKLEGGNIYASGDIRVDGILRGNGTEGIKIASSGNVGIGTLTPTAVLHLKAGTAAANSAPLKFTAGVNLTTPEAGVMEYDGTQLYFTPVAARNLVAQISGSTALTAGSIPFATTNGYLAGDSNSFFWDNANKRLGVGTNAPDTQVTIKQTSDAAGFRLYGYTVPTSYFDIFLNAAGNPRFSTTASMVFEAGNGVYFRSGATGTFFNDGTPRNTSFNNGQLYLNGTGKLGVGTTSPTAYLHLKAGSATAGTAPLKFTSGTNLTTPEAGAMEYDGTNLYFTPSTTRRTIAFTDSDISTMTGTLGVAHGGTGATTLTGVLKGNGTSAITAMTGTANYAARWTDANTLGTGVLYDNGTNVGIGTTNPGSYRLSVAGNAYLNGTLTATGAIAANGGLTQGGNTILNGVDTWLRTTGSTGWYSASYGGGWYMTDTDWIRNYNAKPLYLTGDGAYSAVLMGGNVGIGTNTPAARLDIAQNSTSAALTVAQSGTGNIIDLKDGASSVFYIADGGNVTANGNVTVNGTVAAGKLNTSNIKYTGGGNYPFENAFNGATIEDVPALNDFIGNQLMFADARGYTITTSGSITNATNAFRQGDSYSTITNVTQPIVVTVEGTIASDTNVQSIRAFLQAHGNITAHLLVEVKQADDNWVTLSDEDIAIYGREYWFSPNITSVAPYPASWNLKGIRYTITSLSQATSYIRQFGIYKYNGFRYPFLAEYQPYFYGQIMDSDDGSAALPSYTWSGDTNTGMFSPADEMIGFTTSGVERLRIDGSGNVGIGTNAPASTMEIYAASANVRVVDSSDYAAGVGGKITFSGKYGSTGQVLSGAPYVKAYKMNATDSDFGFGLQLGVRQNGSGDASAAVTIDSMGNVGIGTTSPTAVLNLKAGTATAGSAPLKFTSGTNLTTAEAGAMEYDGTNLYFTPSTVRKTIAFTDSDITGSAANVTGVVTVPHGGTGLTSLTQNGILYGNGTNAVGVTAAGTNNYLLYSNNGTPAWTNAPTISGANITALNAGNISSGTLAAARGGLGFNASTIAKGGLITGTGAGTLGITAAGTDGYCLVASAAATGGVAWTSCASASSAVSLQSTTPGSAQTGNLNISGTGIFGTGVGVGTSSPAYPLDVNGAVGAHGFVNEPINQTVQGLIWSRIVDLNNDGVKGTSFLMNITGTRSNVVWNSTWQVTTSHSAQGYLTLLSSTGYSSTHLRLVVDANGAGYLEFYDDATGAVSGTNQIISVSLYNSVGTSSVLTSFQDGTDTTGYTVKSETTSVAGGFITQGNALVAGKLGVGTTSPTALLHLKAGTAAANTAPLKFTSGINLTTPEAGAMEYDGTQLYFSPSTTRNLLAQVAGSTALTAGSIPFATTSGYLAQDNTHFFWDDANDRLGVGTNSPTYQLDVQGGAANIYVATPDSVSRNLRMAAAAGAGIFPGFTIQRGTENIWAFIGGDGRFSIQRRDNDGSNALSTISAFDSGGVAIGNGFYLNDPGAENMIIAGKLGVGTTSPTAYLTIKAGTATAGTAPLKFTSGTNLTTAETGAMEYDGAQLYFTPAATRNIVAQISGSTALTAGSIPFATTSGYLAQDNANFFWDNTSKWLGLGTNSPEAHLTVVQPGVAPEASQTLASQAQLDSTVSVQGDGQAYFMGRDVTNDIEFVMGTSTVGAAFAGSVTSHAFQLRTNNVTRLTVRETSGNVGIGVTSPTAVLHLKAGSATASTAPLKFTSGVNLTTPEAGAMEYDGTNLYFTPSTVRKTIAFTDSDITGNAANVTGVVTVPHGGTGLTTLTQNGILYGNGTGNVGVTAAGTNNYLLYSNNGTPAWTNAPTISGANITALNAGNISSGTLGVARGGTGATTLTGVLKGNGTSAITAMTGTANYAARWTDANTLGIGTLYDNGTNVGIGTTSPSSKLDIVQNSTSTALTVNQSGTGMIVDIQDAGTSVFSVGQATVTVARPLDLQVEGDVGIEYDLAFLNNAASYITSAGPLTLSAGDRNSYENLTLTTGGTGDISMDIADSVRGLQVIGATGQVLGVTPAGAVGVGVADPTALLHLKAGTATANTAPLKFTSGVNLTTAEAGAMEYDGTQLYFSPSTTRNLLAQISGSTALTPGAVPFAGANGYLAQDNANFFWDDTNNRLGVGTATPTAALDVIGDLRATGEITSRGYVQKGLASTAKNNLASGLTVTSNIVGDSTIPTDGTKTVGSTFYSFGSGSGNGSGGENAYAQIDLGAAKTVSQHKLYFYNGDARYYWFKLKYSYDGISWYYAIGNPTVWMKSTSSAPAVGTGGQVGYVTDIRVPNMNARYWRLYADGSTANTTNHIYEWEIFAEANEAVLDVDGNAYVGGKVGIGTTAPTSYLHLKAGSATAGTAPLKFTSGTNLTTAEAGAMEYDGTNLYFTPSTTRRTIAFTDSDITGNAANVTGTVTVAHGGTGLTTLTQNGILYGNGTNAVGVTAAGTNNYLLYSNNGTPAWTNAPTISGANITNLSFGNITSGMVAAANGGTGLDTSALSGIPHILSGTWSAMTGTANYAARWTDANTLGTGTLYDNGTSVGIGTASPGSYRLNVSGTTYISSTLTVGGAITGVKNALNTVNSNLGTPTVEEMALFQGQFGNKLRFIPAVLQEQSTDGVTWTPSTRASTNALADIMLGEGQTSSIAVIPAMALGGSGYYRLTWDADDTGYVYLNSFYAYTSTQGNTVNIKLEKYHNTTGWTDMTNGNVNNWPGHVNIPHTSVPFSASNANYYGQVRATFSVTSAASTNAVYLYAVEWFGGYPAAKRNVESYDRDKNVTFPAAIRSDYGSASLPGLSFGSDVDTGVYRYAADSLSLATGGQERLRIDSAGNVGIGATPSAYLTLRAGSATASTAPLKFTAGVNLTTPEAGSVEYDGTNLYFTPSTTRRTIAFTDSDITGNAANVTGVVTVPHGGTGLTTLTQNGILYGNGTNAVGVTAAGTNNYLLYSNNGTPAWTNAPTISGANITALNAGNISSGTLSVARGGTGATTLTGVLKGNGTSAITAMTGTANYTARWTNSTTLGTGTLYDNGTRVGIGTAAPTAYLTIKAGTATVNTAPLKFTSGTNLTTPEAGAMEYDGTNLYFSPSTARKTVAFTDSNITGSAGNVTGVVAAANGGTGLNTSATSGVPHIVSGTWSAMTGTTGYNAYWSDANTLAAEQYLAVSRGGTGAGSFTANGILYGTGTSALSVTAAGTSNYILYSNAGTPAWTNAPTISGANITALNAGNISSGTLSVARGGTGATTLTGVLKGNGTSAITAMTGTANYAARWTDANTLGTGTLYDNGTRVGIGTASPTAYLTLRAGTATANTAPLKFTSGVNLTTAEAGAMEYDGTQLYFTPASARNVVAQITGGALTAGSIPFATTSGYLAQDNANFFWDDTNNRLGLGTNAPSSLLTLKSTSDGATLGGELLDANNWTTTGWTGSFGAGFTHTAGNTTALSRTLTSTVGNHYMVAFTVAGRTAGNVTVGLGGNQYSEYFYTDDTFAFGLRTLTANGPLIFTPTSDFNGTISAISVKLIDEDAPSVFDITNVAGDVIYEMRPSYTGFGNLFMGLNVGEHNVTGEANTGVGADALYHNMSGNFNSAFGHEALYSNTAGNYNTAFGMDTLYSNTSGHYNTAVGYNAMGANTIGDDNVAVGMNSLRLNTTGYANTAMGVRAMDQNVTGWENTAVGNRALRYNVSGGENSAFGYQALHYATGSYNSALGHYALYDLTTGNLNTALGRNTGRGITTGSYNTIIGAGVTGLAADLSNTIILADGEGNQRFYIDSLGNAGIGTTAPTARLTVNETASGDIVNIQDTGVSIFKVGQATVDVTRPLDLQVEGDVGMEYNLRFLSNATSYITSAGPLVLSAGDSNSSENLTLTTSGTGDIVIDISGSTLGLGVMGAASKVFGVDPQGNVVIGGVDTGAGDLSVKGDISTLGGNLALGALETPSGVAVTPVGTAGSTTYGYRVSAINSNGETLAATVVTTTTGNATLSATNYNRITWSAVSGATGYKVYGRTAASQLYMATVDAPVLYYNDTRAVVTPAGAVATVNNTGGNNITYAPANGPKRSIVLTAAGAEIPTSGGAAQTKVTGTNHTYYVLDFDAATDESAYWHWTMPDSYDGGSIDITYYWEAAAVTGEVGWCFQAVGISANSAEDIDRSLSTGVCEVDTAQGNANDLASVTESLAASNFAAGEYVAFKVFRDADQNIVGSGSDDMSGDARLVKVKIEYSVNAESD